MSDVSMKHPGTLSGAKQQAATTATAVDCRTFRIFGIYLRKRVYMMNIARTSRHPGLRRELACDVESRQITWYYLKYSIAASL